MAEAPSHNPTPERQTLTWLFCGLTCLFLLTSGGHFYASDDLQKLGALDAFVRTGDSAFPGGWTVGADGQPHSWFALGASLLMLPGYLAGRLATALVPWLPGDFVVRFCITLQNAPITAGTATLLAAYLRRLGYGLNTCLFAASSFALGTMAWPYAKSAWSEPGATLLVFLAFTGLHAASRHGLAPGRVFWACAALAGAALVRYELVVLAPGALAWLCWRHRGEWRALGRAVLAGLPPFFVMAIATLWYNAERYGHMAAFTNFHDVQSQIVYPPGGRPVWALLNLWHYTLNPSDGLFWFAPAVWLGVLGARRFWREQREAASLALAALGPLLLFFVGVWGLSDWAWGQRYAYVFQPFLCLPAAALWQGAPHRRALWSAVAGLGLAVQLLAVSQNFNFLLERERLRYPDLPVQAIMADPAHSPLLLAARALPATLAGGVALVTTHPAPGPQSVASYRERAQFVPDVWPCLQLLTPMSRTLVGLGALLLLLGTLFSGWKLLKP